MAKLLPWMAIYGNVMPCHMTCCFKLLPITARIFHASVSPVVMDVWTPNTLSLDTQIAGPDAGCQIGKLCGSGCCMVSALQTCHSCWKLQGWAKLRGWVVTRISAYPSWFGKSFAALNLAFSKTESTGRHPKRKVTSQSHRTAGPLATPQTSLPMRAGDRSTSDQGSNLSRCRLVSH